MSYSCGGFWDAVAVVAQLSAWGIGREVESLALKRMQAGQINLLMSVPERCDQWAQVYLTILSQIEADALPAPVGQVALELAQDTALSLLALGCTELSPSLA